MQLVQDDLQLQIVPMATGLVMYIATRQVAMGMDTE